MKERIEKPLRALYADNLFRNSFYPILGTMTTGAFGFLFWLFAARLFPAENIGLATTLLSVMTLTAMLGLVGFDTVFVRFLPNSQEKNKVINTGLIAVGAATAILASLFLIFANSISPYLGFVREGFLPIAFVFFCVIAAFNILTDSIFLSNRATPYAFCSALAMISVRFLFLLLFLREGTVGLFSAVALSQAIGFTVSITFLYVKFNYRPAAKIHAEIFRQVRGYSGSNYLAGILLLLPGTLLPIMVTNTLGPEKAAFYNIVMMIGNFLYAVPWATTRSLFAEGSRDPETLAANMRKSLKIVSALMLPVIVIFVFAGDFLLGFFGKNYSAEGFRFLQLVAITGIAVTALSLLETFFRVTHSPHWLILINASYFATIWATAVFLLPSYGLTGIGIAWLSGYAVASVVSYLLLRLHTRIS